MLRRRIKMSHTLFDGLAGVSLDGDSSGLGASEVRFEDPVSSITGIITLDDEDVFQCGRCRKQFSSLPMFMNHKQQHAVSSGKTTTVLEVDAGGGAEPYDPLSQLEHADLVSDAEAVGQSIILNDEILFSIDQQVGESQMLPSLEASAVRDVTSWDAVEDSMRLKLVASADEADAACLMDTPTSQAFEDALCATQQAVLEPPTLPPPEQPLPNIKTPKLACGFCHKPFSKKFDLEQHIRSHTGEKPFQCVVCGRAFSQKSNVKKHMFTHKVWPKGQQRTLPKEPIQALVEQIPVNDAKTDKKEQVRVIVDSSYVCQFCEKAFTSYFELKTHMKDHSQEKVYRCIQKNCNQTFPDLTAFLEHTRCHQSSSQFRCHACGKNFNSLAALGTHHYAHTSGLGLGKPCSKQKPKDFPCTKCKSRFATPEALDHHMHSNSHKFQCNLCSKIFACERYLRRHLQTHSSESTLYPCDICGKAFRTEHYLRTHKITHTNDKPYQCGECSASFNRRDKLTRHKLTHENLKRFKCPFRLTLGCTKDFNRQDKLKQHILTHASVRPGKKSSKTAADQSKNNTTTQSGQIKLMPATALPSDVGNCHNCSVRLSRKCQHNCQNCRSPILVKQKYILSESQQQQNTSKRIKRNTYKKMVEAARKECSSEKTENGMSTIEIIVVPMHESSECQVADELVDDIDFNYDTAQTPPPLALSTTDSLMQNPYLQQSSPSGQILFDTDAGNISTDFSSILASSSRSCIIPSQTEDP